MDINAEIEKLLLKEIDKSISESNDNTEKIVLELFKSSVLKKYQESYNLGLLQGEIKKGTISKYIDYCFSEACVAFRTFSSLDDNAKEEQINKTRSDLESIKQTISNILRVNGIRII